MEKKKTLLDLLPSNVSAPGEQPRRREEELRPRLIDHDAKGPERRWAVLISTGVPLLFSASRPGDFTRESTDTDTNIWSRY